MWLEVRWERRDRVKLLNLLWKFFKSGLNFSPTPGLDRISLDCSLCWSRMTFTWSVWPFLSSLTVVFSLSQSSFCNQDWRGKGKSEQGRTWPKTARPISLRAAVVEPNCRAQQSWLCSGNTEPGAAREQRTLLLVPKCLYRKHASAHVPLQKTCICPCAFTANMSLSMCL